MRQIKKFFRLSVLVAIVSLCSLSATGQTQWETVVNDDVSTISYDTNITDTRSGNHIVWVKTRYKTADWQQYLTRQSGAKRRVVSTKTKAMYDENYNYVMVRDVYGYDKNGRVVFHTGDDTSAGWGPVNASDPLGIVGEYLGNQNEEY